MESDVSDPDFGSKRPDFSASLASVLMAVGGLVVACIPFWFAPPGMRQLEIAEGELSFYSLQQTGGSSGSLLALFKIAGYRGRFRNEALKDGQANRLSAKNGSSTHPQ
jgi:hypothetical protein